jgi:hypothetical protein
MTHITFSVRDNARGDFYINNVFSPTQQTHGVGGYLTANSNGSFLYRILP